MARARAGRNRGCQSQTCVPQISRPAPLSSPPPCPAPIVCFSPTPQKGAVVAISPARAQARGRPARLCLRRHHPTHRTVEVSPGEGTPSPQMKTELAPPQGFPRRIGSCRCTGGDRLLSGSLFRQGGRSVSRAFAIGPPDRQDNSPGRSSIVNISLNRPAAISSSLNRRHHPGVTQDLDGIEDQHRDLPAGPFSPGSSQDRGHRWPGPRGVVAMFP